MWWRRSFSRAALPSLSSLFPLSNLKQPTTTHSCKPTTILLKFSSPLINNPPISSLSFSSSPKPSNASSSININDDDDDDEKSDTDDDLESPEPTNRVAGDLLRDVVSVVASLRDFVSDGAGAKRRLEQSGVPASPELVTEVLSRLRNDWGAAFTFFLWAGKQPGYSHSVRDYHSMISILGKARRFDTAWSLVDEMRRLDAQPITPQTILILIRRYSAVHDVGRAINAFYSLKKYGFKAEIDDFHGLLGALCRYKNVQDAEHLLLCNERTFPFDTKSFNIVLNGWCNVMVHLQQAKRFWRDMGNRGITKDVVSYASMISCYSKAGNLNDVLKLFDRMKDAGIEPDRKVYNAVVYALAKGKCVEEARCLLKTMEVKGVAPNAVTFNSLIKPLCKARRTDDARVVFDEMLKRGLSPSIRTYHAFFDVSRTADEVFDLLNQMKQTRCCPANETYIMLIRKLCRWRQHECVFRLWDEMLENGLSHDRSAYIVLIHGLFLNGKLEEASSYYEEMKAKGFEPEPKTDEMIQAWLSGKEVEGNRAALDSLGKKPRGASNASSPRRGVLQQSVTRTVTRERGFSLW